GADAEVRRVAERHQARVTDEQVEARGEERPDDDVVGHERVEARARRRYQQRGDEDEQWPRNARAANHRSGRPSRPQGRMMSTAAISAKTAKIEKRGKNRMPNDST